MIEKIVQAVKLAGDAILNMQRQDLIINKKANNEMVTAADLLANAMLKQALLSALPNAGWLSEESIDDKDRLQCEQVFIIDPIDGTQEYANQVPEYAISVALIEKGLPMLGVIFNPAKGALFHAVRGQGAWLNDVRIHCRKRVRDEKMIFLASRSEVKRGEWAYLQDKMQIEAVGSIAYKLGLLAAGQAHATGSLGPKNEWDIAAGVLIVQEAGGWVGDKHQQQFQFNQPKVLVDGIVATSADTRDEIFNMLNEE